jgi:hypothetical protein
VFVILAPKARTWQVSLEPAEQLTLLKQHPNENVVRRVQPYNCWIPGTVQSGSSQLMIRHLDGLPVRGPDTL